MEVLPRSVRSFSSMVDLYSLGIGSPINLKQGCTDLDLTDVVLLRLVDTMELGGSILAYNPTVFTDEVPVLHRDQLFILAER